MPYYGDTANCKMTAEQATAFAQLIADGLAGDFGFRGGYDENEVNIVSWSEPFQVFDYDMGDFVNVDRKNVMLGDFSGEGIPYLYVFSSTNDEYNFSYEIYGWSDDVAKLVYDTDIAKSAGNEFYLYEDEEEPYRIKQDCIGYYPPEIYYEVTTYAFSEGGVEKVSERTELFDYESDVWHIAENGVENLCTDEEYESLNVGRKQGENHTHTLPYTCFYDMQPCTLEEMVNYLNAYASVLSDGQSVPVEIKKLDIVKHEGTGITTKGEMPQWKVNGLEVLRQYMVGKRAIGCVDDVDACVYSYEFGEGGMPEAFYFELTDINGDNRQEL